jgi:putative spermidine/putrescine transport system substrate-binding protein
MFRKSLFVLIAMAVALALLGVACGDDDDDDTGASETSTPSSGTASPATDDLTSQFPADVQDLVSDLPTELQHALLDLRDNPGTLKFHGAGGAAAASWRAAAWNEFEDITGWTVADTAPCCPYDQLKLQIDAGNPPDWDLIEIGSLGDALTIDGQGLLGPLDYSLLDWEKEQLPEGIVWEDNWLQYGQFAALLIWNTDVWPESGTHPTSTLDLFNTTDFPGKRCFEKYPQFAGTLEFPLLADGVSKDDLYPLDVERALAKLDSIKGDIAWWEDGAEPVQFVATGECDLSVAWHGRVATALEDDPTLPIGIAWDDALYIDAAFGIPKGATNADAASALLAYWMAPRNQCDNINDNGYGIPFDTSCMDEYGKTWGVDAERASTGAFQDPEYYNENLDSLVDQFNAWLGE